MEGRAATVSALVGALKAGQISKSELFSKLSALQKSAPGVVAAVAVFVEAS